MKRYFSVGISVVLFISFFVLSDAFAQKALYDDFSADRIDSAKWDQIEFVREVDPVQKKLVSEVATETGYKRNRTQCANSGSIAVIEALISVAETSLDTGNDTRAFARIEGFFYNTQPSGGVTGDVWASVRIEERGNGLEAYWSIEEVLDENYSNWAIIASGTLIESGTLEYDTEYKAKIEYNEINNSFTFSAAGTSILIDASQLPSRQRPATSPSKNLTTGIDSNSQNGVGYIYATFDDVYINNEGTPYDTFETAPLDQTKWQHLEFVREIQDGKLRLTAHSKQNTETESTSLNFARLQSYIEATVTVKSTSWINSGAKGRTRIDGFFYNDTYQPSQYNGREGNVWAQVYIDYYDNGTLEAKCYAERVMNPDNTQVQELFFQRFTVPIIFDRPYTLSLWFTGTKFIFTCTDTVTEAEESIEYQITTPAYEPSTNSQRLLSRVYGNGSSGYMAVEFDDVYVEADVVADFTADVTSGPVPLSVNFTDQSTGDVSSWSWDFGDGATSTEQNPTHTYTESGTYTVSLTVTGPEGTDTETKTDFIEARDASFSTAAAFAVLANMYSDSAMANAVNALDDPAYYPLAALYASSAYDYAEDAYEDATAALAAAGQDYTFWGYYAPVYAESDIDVRADAVTSINLAAQYAALGDLDTAEYYLGYGSSLAATADFYNGPTIWCASMESSGQAAAQQSSASSEVEPLANGASTFSSAATNAVLANMNFATSVTYGVSALEDPANIPLVQLYAQTAYDYAEAAYNDASAALAAAGQDATFWGTYAVEYAEFDMTYKADALSAFDQAVQAYYAGDLETASYYLGYGFLPACSADLYNATTIWCASMESEGATK